VAASNLDTRALARALERVFGAGRIEGVRRLSGGASRETWSFEHVAADGTARGLVLRRDPGNHGGVSDRSTEYTVLAAAAAAGVPVPRLCLLLQVDDALGRGFVMERVEGETIPRRILRDQEYTAARPRLARQCGEVAARIHRIDSAAVPSLAVQTADVQLEQYRTVLDTFDEPHPAFELGLRVLADHLPPERPPAFVHGDFRNGNFIVDRDGLRAVLDWELAHLGDPTEDLGWLCVKSWRFGVVDKVAGGFGSVDQLLEGYEAGGGAPVDRAALQWWITLGTLKWGVICMSQAFTHLNGVVRSVELATLGRRVAEMEWDLLELLEGART